MTSSPTAKIHGSGTSSRIRLPVILYILTFMVPIKASLGGLVLSGDRILLLLFIIPLTVNLIMGRYGRLLIVDILFFLHVLWGIIALLINNPDRVVSFMGSNSIEFIGGYVMGRAFIRNRDEFFSLCQLLAVLAALTLPLALYETLTGDPVILRTLANLPGVSSTSAVQSAPRYGWERVQVFLTHPIHYGLFTAMFLSIVFVGFKGVISDVKRYILTFIILICTLLSLSSGPLLALVLQCGLILWAWLFRGTRARWLILLCVTVTAYVVVDLLSNRTPFRVFLHYATLNSHTAYWRATIFEWGMKNVWDNPIFGIGLNEWERPWYMYSGSMDNFWLVMAVRYGIPGFLLLALGYTLGVFRVMRRNLDGDPVLLNLRRAWVFTFIGLSFTLSTVHVWFSIYSFVFFMFGAGMWFITATPRNSGEPVSKTINENRYTALPYTRFSASQNGPHNPPIRS